MAKAKKKAPAKKATPKKAAAKKAAPKKVEKKTSTAKTAVKTTAKKASSAKAAPKKAAAAKPATANKAAAPVSVKKSPAMDWENFLTPLDDRLIVQASPGERMTAGGLYIPEASDASGNFKGKVLVAGRGHRDSKGRIRPMDVKTGDTVLFSEFTGAKLSLMGEDLLLLRESEILGIVDKD